MKTLGIFAAGYLARPLGGIIMAHFGDIIGRKRMFYPEYLPDGGADTGYRYAADL
ncbi:shikimate transporter [Morganella morganii]|nr:shikimate transporter [Morganella morganii]